MVRGAIHRRSGSWCFRVDITPHPVSGRRRQVSRQGFSSKAKAVRALREVLAETEPPRIVPAEPASVRQVARSWLDRKAPTCSAPTVPAYRRSVDKICEGLGDVAVGDLTVAMVDEFARWLLKTGSAVGGALSAKSVLGVHAVLHQILDDAVRRGMVHTNVAASASPPRCEASVVRVWSSDEVRTFLAESRRHRLFPAFVVLLTTGLTRGELVGLRWEDVDLGAGTVEVRRVVSMTLGKRTESNPARAARRLVTIGDRTVELLAAHQAETGARDAGAPVFEKRGGGEMNPESLSATFQRLVARSDVSPITIGGLRHTHAAIALNAGVHPLVVSRRLGHSTSATTHQMYRHLIPPLFDANIETLDGLLFEAET